MPFKLGRKKKVISLKTPCLTNFLDRISQWPAVAARGYEFAVPDDQWDMFGNDQWGDCAEAMAGHYVMATSYNTGNRLKPTLQQVLDFYTAAAGFDPNAGPAGSNPTDSGTVLLNMLNVWKSDGFPVTDSNGNVVVHKILGYASLDITNWALMRWAAFTFGGFLKGINCPQSAMQNTSNWNYDPTSPIAGGHAVYGASEGSAGDQSISWGMRIPTTVDFELHLLDEAYVVVTESWLNAQGKSPSGLDMNGLLAALKQI